MAVSIPNKCVTQDILNLITKLCTAKPKTTQYNDNPKDITCFKRLKNNVLAPLGIWDKIYETFPDRTFTTTNVNFINKTLYTESTDSKKRDQDVVSTEAIKKLKKDHKVFLACYPGFGKTTIANYLMCHFKVKTLVMCHIDTVNSQWVEEFEKFSTAKVQKITDNIDPNADVYIVGVRKLSTLPREIFNDIGMVIFDEAHIATITAFSQSLLKFEPRYVIGLSATPKRSDGMQKLIQMYFGPRNNYIIRKEVKDFQVYKIRTGFKPDVKYLFTNKGPILDWTTIISSIAFNKSRQAYIINLILKNLNHRILFLSDRQEECKFIYEKVKEKEKSVLLLIGNVKREDTSKYNVIIAGMKKAGVGFNDPTLTMLILSTDRSNVEQMEGRIRTVNNVIYDLVDDHQRFEKHWSFRERWYRERGANISYIDLSPNLPKQRLLGPAK